MSPPAVDWRLALEFVKALAGPLGTLVGAVLVARLALAGFRRQKAIERRLDWYERMHRHLASTGRLYMLAAHVKDGQEVARRQETVKAVQELTALADEGWMYADQAGFDAIQVLGSEMERALDAHGTVEITPSLASRISNICYVTSNALADEIRRELRLPKVRPKEWPPRSPKSVSPAA